MKICFANGEGGGLTLCLLNWRVKVEVELMYLVHFVVPHFCWILFLFLFSMKKSGVEGTREEEYGQNLPQAVKLRYGTQSGWNEPALLVLALTGVVWRFSIFPNEIGLSIKPWLSNGRWYQDRRRGTTYVVRAIVTTVAILCGLLYQERGEEERRGRGVDRVYCLGRNCCGLSAARLYCRRLYARRLYTLVSGGG